MKYQYLKNYFLIFLTTYLVLLSTKFIFMFYLYENFSNFDTTTLIKTIFLGYKFDFAAVSLITFLSTLFDFNKKYLTIAPSILIPIVFLSQISDIMYFDESSRHMGYEVQDALTDAFGLIMTAFSQHTLLSALSISFSIILYIYLNKKFKTKLHPITLNKIYLLKKLILILITVFFIRGMFQHIPLNPWQSNNIGDTTLASLALNGSYNTIYTLANKSKKLKSVKLPYMNDKDINKNIQKLYASEYKKYKTPLRKPNIIFFFLESWSGVNLKSYGYPKTTTPFFDSILEKSIRPTAMIAGGHRTTEGMFSSLSSYQNPLGRTVAKTQLQDLKYSSIVDILNANGYKSIFFQGSSKETSGTGAFAQKLGFKESYGKRDVKKRLYEENYWGIHDVDLYNFTLKKIDKIKEPFVLGINGATTHDNKIPATIEEKDFSKDEKLNKKLNALNFSDYALGKFFQKVLDKYPNTIFVFFADHCGGGVNGGAFHKYMIPFAIYHKDLKAKFYDTYLSQRDIAPTVLDLSLGDYKKYSNNFSGKSLLSDNEFFADYFHSGTLGWIEKNNAIELNIVNNNFECFKIVNLKQEKSICDDKMKTLKDKALAFTKQSQKLLFEGNTMNFNKYKD